MANNLRPFPQNNQDIILIGGLFVSLILNRDFGNIYISRSRDDLTAKVIGAATTFSKMCQGYLSSESVYNRYGIQRFAIYNIGTIGSYIIEGKLEDKILLRSATGAGYNQALYYLLGLSFVVIAFTVVHILFRNRDVARRAALNQ